MSLGTRIWGLAAMLGVLSACAPITETRYTFLPPEAQEGQACVARCSTVNSQCLAQAEKVGEADRIVCEEAARQDYDVCLMRSPSGDSRETCEIRDCRRVVDTSACDVPYRACFQECGGFIESRQVCTFNCK